MYFGTTGRSRTIPQQVLAALLHRATQTPIKNAKEGCDLLWTSAVLKQQSGALISHVTCALFSEDCTLLLDGSHVADVLFAAVEGGWLLLETGARTHSICGDVPQKGGAGGGDAGGMCGVEQAGRELVVTVCRRFEGFVPADNSPHGVEVDLVALLHSVSSLLETCSEVLPRGGGRGGGEGGGEGGGGGRGEGGGVGAADVRAALYTMVAAVCSEVREQQDIARGTADAAHTPILSHTPMIHTLHTPSTHTFPHLPLVHTLFQLRAVTRAHTLLLLDAAADTHEWGRALEEVTHAASCFLHHISVSVDWQCMAITAQGVALVCEVAQVLMEWAPLHVGYRLW